MKRTLVSDCKFIDLKRNNHKGDFGTYIFSNIDIPFDIKRIYYLYDIPKLEFRGAHAHKNLKQLFIALSGSFVLEIYDGKSKIQINLNDPYTGIYMPPGLWRNLKNFSDDSVCLVLASLIYNERDYIRDISDFLKYKNDP